MKLERTMDICEFPKWFDAQFEFDGQLIVVMPNSPNFKVIDGIKTIKTSTFKFDRLVMVDCGPGPFKWSGWANKLVWISKNLLLAVVEPKWF